MRAQSLLSTSLSENITDNWSVVESFLPANWEALADINGVMQKKRSTGFGNYRNLLQTLLLHSAKGYSLTETSVRASNAGIASVSSVAIMDGLRKSEEWLKSLCVNLYNDNKNIISPRLSSGIKMKICDSTVVAEQGKTGSQWRIHYGISLPSFDCSHFLLTNSKGKGSGESLSKYPVEKGDCFIADRGYSHFNDVKYVVDNGADVIVRVNHTMLKFRNVGSNGNDNDNLTKFNLLPALATIEKAGTIKEWPVYLCSSSKNLGKELGKKPSKKLEMSEKQILGRICAIKKSDLQIEVAKRKAARKASKNGGKVSKESLEYSQYIVVFTTLGDDIYNAEEILNWYRVRWQIELTFKRFKSIAGLGCLPKYNEQSSRAWLYSKLLISLLTEKMILYSTISPWGYCAGQDH